MPPAPAAATAHTTAGVRPLFWRLPLSMFLAVGALTLWYLDGRLSREYSVGAVAEAVRTDALLESAIGHRVTLLHSLRSLIADSPDSVDRNRRLRAFAEQVTQALPDVRRVYRLEADGSLGDAYPRPRDDDLLAAGGLGLRPVAEALIRARDTRRTTASGLVPLHPDTLGLLFYDPVIHDGRIVGYVALGIGYAELLRRTLASEPEGEYGYRISDTTGRVIGLSPRFPRRIAQFIQRSVALPGGNTWRLDIAVEPFQPALARATLWIVGGLLLGLVVLIVLRENARSERLALHSARLERLSRDLLDANVRLEERNRQVSEANRAKSRFLANVSHELRTPINAILGYNALALGGIYGELGPAQTSAHQRVDAAAKHLLSLVDDVLDLSKIETGRMEVAPEEVDVAATMREVARVVAPSAAAKGIQIDIDATDAPATIRTDPRHLRQILLNLASNAIKFTPEGTVTMAARGRGDRPGELTIEVSDTGIGIPPQELERIFDEFEQVRADGRGDSITRGAGLGLTVARKLARLLGGDVRAESRVGQGSRFRLELPAEPATPPAMARADTPEAPRPPLELETPIPALPEVPLADVGAPRAGAAIDADAARTGARGVDDAPRPG